MGTPPRRRFAERMGVVPVVVQIDDMNDRLRWAIWNVIDSLMTYDQYAPRRRDRAVREIAVEVLRVSLMTVPSSGPAVWLYGRFAELPWYEVYEVLEHVVGRAPTFAGNKVSVASAMQQANRILEAEHSGFRFIGGQLTRVMHPAEAAGIEDAMVTAERVGLDGVHQQITQALTLFGKRPNPDHRNAIKEAISAVEGAVKLIQGVRGGGITSALTALDKKLKLHPAFKDGMVKFYGFTSDQDGIRHPILDEPNIGEEDARFMIVACSAAVNWIIAKAEKAGLLKKES